MTLLSLIAALVLEQWRPLGSGNRAALLFARYADALERQFNAGEPRQGTIAWLLAVVPVLLAVGVIHAWLYRLSPLLAWAWNVAILYLTMGFRKFSHAFTAIGEALRRDDLDGARELLAKWRGRSAAEFSRVETARVAIEQGLVCSHRYVFGVIAWFAVFGAAGALLYRLAAMLGEKWGGQEAEFGAFGKFAARAFEAIDWIPVRLTAFSFAIVGDFEDAVYCWRSQALSWIHRAQGILLASGAGALGVRLGESLHENGGVRYRPELGVGDEADADYMQSTVGLIWRTLVLWLGLLLLLTLASWAG